MSIVTDELLTGLTDWYWKYNPLRDPHVQVSPGWLLSVAEAQNYLDETRAIEGKPRNSLAVWGPSQSGKSTFLSYFIDDAASGNCALAFKPGEAASFTGINAPEGAVILNPHNDIGDASGCVTRFTKQETVPLPDWPIEIGLAERRDIMLSLALGYTEEAQVQKEGELDREFDEENIVANLPEDTGGHIAERDNLAFLFDLLHVLDRLIDLRGPRFMKLVPTWVSETKNRLLTSTLQHCSMSELKRFAFDVLWDGRPAINEVFERMVDLRDRLEQKVGAGKPLHTNVRFARYLLNIQSYQDMVDATPGSDNEGAELIKALRLKIDEQASVIATDVAGEDILDGDTLAFGMLQGLVWELSVPLNAAVIDGRSASIGNFLDSYEVIDIPGVPNKDQGVEESKLNFGESAGVRRQDILVRIMKRGKTLSIIDRFATPGHVDHLLILARGDRHLPKAKYLSQGIRSIVSPGQSALDAYKVPLSICLTFMASDMNTRASNTAQTFPFEAKKELIQPLGADLTGHQNCALYLTTYRHIPIGAFNCDRKALERVRDQIVNDRWFSENFTLPANDGTLDAMLFDEDGGVGFLLGKLQERGNEIDRAAVLRARRNRLDAVVRAAIDRIRPPAPREDQSNVYRAAFEDLVECIEAASETRNLEETAARLRDIFSFSADSMADIARSNKVDANIRGDLLQEIERWKERSWAQEYLRGLGVSGQGPSLILEAMADQIDVEETLTWLKRKQQLVDSQKMARKMKHFLSVFLTNQLLEEAQFHRNQVAAPQDTDLLTYARDRIAKWRSEDANVWEGPANDMIVVPLIERLIAVGAQSGERKIREQQGDDELRTLLGSPGDAEAGARS